MGQMTASPDSSVVYPLPSQVGQSTDSIVHPPSLPAPGHSPPPAPPAFGNGIILHTPSAGPQFVFFDRASKHECRCVFRCSGTETNAQRGRRGPGFVGDNLIAET